MRTEESETLKVRGGADEEIAVVETHHGPVVAGNPDNGVGLTLSDPGAKDGTLWVDAALGAMKSRSANEFLGALSEWTDRVNNYPYADVHGNFGYALRGRIPVRPSAAGWGPVEGWTGEFEWEGNIPSAELPESRNPAIGYVVTCNQRIVGDEYPHYLGVQFGSAFRAQRVTDRLNELRGGPVDPSDMAAIHADRRSIPMLAYAGLAASCATTAGPTGEAARLLGNWDGEMSLDSAEAAICAVLKAEVDKDAGQGPLRGRHWLWRRHRSRGGVSLLPQRGSCPCARSCPRGNRPIPAPTRPQDRVFRRPRCRSRLSDAATGRRHDQVALGRPPPNEPHAPTFGQFPGGGRGARSAVGAYRGRRGYASCRRVPAHRRIRGWVCLGQ